MLPGLSKSRATPFIISLALAVMVWVVYGQTLRHQFVSYDDSVYIYENPVVKNGLTLRGIAWAFTYGEIGHWHPVTWMTHMLDCQLYGLWAGGHHLTNVLLQCASAVLLFLVLREMTGALWRSAFVAAVFAVHPLHVESVAWVAERKDVLSGLFFMLTLWAYIRYARGPRSPIRYLTVVVLFAVGLMCKNMLVTLPFMLLLLDYWPLRRWEDRAGLLRLTIEKFPLFALSVASCIITGLVPEKLSAIDRLPFPLRLENAVVSCAIYLRQMVWPAGLAAPYPDPAGYFPLGEMLLALAVLGAISTAVFLFRKNRPWLVVGWLWYLGMLAPVIGIVQISTYSHADRYTYLPQIGLYIAVAWLAAEGCGRLHRGNLVAGSAAAIILAGLMFLARIQTSYWKDDSTLWTHTLAVMPDNAAAHNNLGRVLEDHGYIDAAIAHYRAAIKTQYNLAAAHYNLGDALRDWGEPGEAISQFQEALDIQPDYAQAHMNLGDVLLDSGRVDEAIVHFQAALAIQPRSSKARNNLGNAFLKKGDASGAVTQYEQALKIQPANAEANYNLGNILLQNGQLDEAAAYLQKALDIQPGLALANYNLGMILLQRGRPDEAILLFEKSLATQPRNAEANVSLGNVLLQKGEVDEAIGHFQKALAIQPDLAKAHTNLAVALAQKGRVDEAIAHLQRALEIEPGLAKAHSNLGVILLQKGRLDEAIAQFKKALEIQPNLAEAHYDLGLCLTQKGQFDAAIGHFRKAVEIQPGYADAQNHLDQLLATHPQHEQ